MSKVMTKIIASHQSSPIDLPKTIFNHQPGESEANINHLPFRGSHNFANHLLFILPGLFRPNVEGLVDKENLQ